MDHHDPDRVAVIDLGSNTARLIVLSATAGYAFRLEDEIRKVVRLRQGMTKKGLSPEASERALSTLRLFKRFCDSTQTNVVLATATSAVRDAANGAEFVDRVQREIGLELRILDGEREAYYGALGALNEVVIGNGLILDIGGGSAQISEVADSDYRRGQSLTLGALALTERFVRNDPPKKSELEAVHDEIETQLDSIKWLSSVASQQLVGIGGTIRNLAKIEAERQGYPLNTLHSFRLTRSSVEESRSPFASFPSLIARRSPVSAVTAATSFSRGPSSSSPCSSAPSSTRSPSPSAVCARESSLSISSATSRARARPARSL